MITRLRVIGPRQSLRVKSSGAYRAKLELAVVQLDIATAFRFNALEDNQERDENRAGDQHQAKRDPHDLPIRDAA